VGGGKTQMEGCHSPEPRVPRSEFIVTFFSVFFFLSAYIFLITSLFFFAVFY
jgi:hypothetical protein